MNGGEDWTITNRRHDRPARRQHNSVFTVSNGYLGLTGSLHEDYESMPVTLINGVYDEIDQFGTLRLSSQPRPYLDPAYFDRAGPSPAVANLPSPLAVRVYVVGRQVALGRGEIRGFEQSLDLRSGLYRYRLEYRDAAGRTTRIENERFAALDHAHRVFERYRLTPLDYDGPVRVLSGLTAAVRSNTTGQVQFDVHELRAEPPERCLMHVRTRARGHEVRIGVEHAARGLANRGPAAVVDYDGVYTGYEFNARRGQTVTLERHVALTCSEDSRHGVAASLEAELAAAAQQGFEAALAEQRAAWAALWERADVRVAGDEQAQRYLRFCLFHLLAAAPRHSDRLSVPVRLLSGEYYQGNVFWDTDLYIVPVYTFTFPELARRCLSFRYHGLTHARALARELGCNGAKFAWQAGPYGEECLGPWYRFVRTNIHINADVAYSLMQYHQASGDEAFLRECGLEILVETARFYHSRATEDPEQDGLTFADVAGPDEAHCGCRSNFYTNYLARRCLYWAAETVARLRAADAAGYERLARRLGLAPDEPRAWRRTADRLVLLFDPRRKLYEQCAGFFSLPPLPAEVVRQRREWFGPIYSYQALNQPDVVMALMLFREDFDPAVRQANWQYYRDRCQNFSSMSFAINALAAADAGQLDEAYHNFLISAGMDLDESLTGRHDTHAGLHGTAMGGAWLAAVLGFAGLSLSQRGLRVSPRLPTAWSGMSLRLALRGKLVNVHLDHQHVTLSTTGGQLELPITVGDQQVRIAPGKTRVSYGR